MEWASLDWIWSLSIKKQTLRGGGPEVAFEVLLALPAAHPSDSSDDSYSCSTKGSQSWLAGRNQAASPCAGTRGAGVGRLSSGCSGHRRTVSSGGVNGQHRACSKSMCTGQPAGTLSKEDHCRWPQSTISGKSASHNDWERRCNSGRRGGDETSPRRVRRALRDLLGHERLRRPVRSDGAHAPSHTQPSEEVQGTDREARRMASEIAQLKGIKKGWSHMVQGAIEDMFSAVEYGMQRSRAWCGTPPILGVVNMVGTRNFTCYMGAL